MNPTTLNKIKKNTTDTTAELCLYYNLAFNRLNELIAQYEGKSIAEIEVLNFDTSNILLKKETYLHLKVYLWKGNISKHYTQILERDIKLIHLTLKKLADVRNFHSHYYHDAEALRFPQELINHIHLLREEAKSALVFHCPDCKEHFETLEKLETTDNKIVNHFNYFDKDNTILREGKNFFLSFFLLKGEMSKFLKKRRGCKRDEGKHFQAKAKLLSFYCHKDGSNRFFLRAKDEYEGETEPLLRQFNTILNYLKSKPVADKKYLPPVKKQEITDLPDYNSEEYMQQQTEEQEYIRRTSKFAPLAVRFFMDMNQLGYVNNSSVYWRVKSYAYTEIEKQASQHIASESNKSYMKVKPLWHNKFEKGYFPIFNNNHIQFRINDSPPTFNINERELKNWLFYILTDTNASRKTLDQTIAAVMEFGQQYKQAIDQLCQTNTITESNYPLLFGADGLNRKLVSELQTQILEQSKQNFDEEKYRSKITTRINYTTNFLKYQLANKNTLTRNKKNRTILRCLNWYLPIQAKLKPDEVNMVSIFNYVADNTTLSNNTRRGLIRPIEHKLSKATEGAWLLLQSAQSFDDLFEKIIAKKCASLKACSNNVAQMPLHELHKLAQKLGVRMNGTSHSRNNNDRLCELKDTIQAQPILIPNGFFKSYFDAHEDKTISTQIKVKKHWGKLLIEENYELVSQHEYINGAINNPTIALEILDAVDKNFDSVFKTFTNAGTNQKFKNFVALFKPFIAENLPEKQLVEAINLYKQLKEIKVQDALLAQILFKYHAVNSPVEKNEEKYCNIGTLFENEYSLRIGNTLITLKYKQLDDLATYWNRIKIDKLFKNNAYWNANIEKELKSKGIDNHQRMIYYIFNSLYEDSYHYIYTILNVEKSVFEKLKNTCLKQLETESMLNKQGMVRLEPKVLFDRTDLTKRQKTHFIELRNSAFHADVPYDNRKYETEKIELARLTNITLPEKKDKLQYKK